MSKLYSLSFVRENRPPLHYVHGRDVYEWNDSPDGLVLFTDFSEMMETIDSMREEYKDLGDDEKALFGTVRNKKDSYGVYLYDTESILNAMIRSTPVGEVITAEGQLTTNEVEIKAVMYTGY